MQNKSGKNQVLLQVLLAVVVLAVLWCGLTAPAEAETWKWTANTEADLAGYNAHLAPGTCANPGPYAKVGIFAKTATIGTTPLSPDGVYCGKLNAFDTAGNLSLFSDTVEVTINVNPPAAPVGFSLTAQ